MQIAILAAGRGSRLAALGVPKPLSRLGDRTLARRIVDEAALCNPSAITFVTDPHQPEVGTALHAIPGVKVVERHTDSPLLSLRALDESLPDDALVLMTVDTVLPPGALRDFCRAWAASRFDALLGVTGYVDDEKPLYVHTSPDGTVTALASEPDEAGYVSAGVYAVSRDDLHRALETALDAGCGRLRDFQNELLRLRPGGVGSYDIGTAVDIDRPEDLAAAANLFPR